MIVTDKTPGFKAFKAHCAYFGIPDDTIINVEELPKPPRVPREAKTATTDEINYADLGSIDITGGRYRNNLSWYKKANTFDGKTTYYYVDFYYTDPMWNGNSIGSDVDAVLRFLKKNAAFPTTETTVWGINVKNKKLLKVGKWVNVVDLAKDLMKKHQTEFEHNMYLLNQNDALGRLANVRRLVTDTTLLTKLSNKDTVAKFRALTRLAKDVQEVNTDTASICKLFGLKATAKGTLDIDVKEFEKILEEKYLGVFSMVDHYSAPAAKLARVINFIDEKS